MRFARVATWVLVGIGALASVAAALAMARAGIGWDSPVDVRALGEIRAIPDGSTKDAAYALVTSTSEFYGILIPQLAEGLHWLATGVSSPLEAWDLAAYRWQSGVTIGLAVLAAACLGYATGRALRSPLAGAFSWALTMTTPLFFGMSYVDFKDMPVAAGLSLISAGLILSRVLEKVRWRAVVGFVLLACGSVVTLGTRPGAWPMVLALMLGSLIVFALIDVRRKQLRSSSVTAIGIGVAAIVTLLVLWVTNPLGRIDLLGWLSDSFSVMRAYPWDGVTRAAGQDFSATDLPLWYVPAWLLAQLPLLTTVAMIWSFIAAVGSLFGVRWSVARGNLVDIAPVAIQGLLLPAVIVASGAVIYDGLRHVLFMIPALASLSGIGIAALERGTWPRPSRALAVAATLALVVVVASSWATLRWAPYSYAFINPVAGLNHEERAWELDYWGVSAIEGVRLLQEAGLPAVSVEPTINTSDMVGSVYPDDAKSQAPDGYGLYVFHRGDASIGACDRLFTIERDGQVLGEGARCTKWDR